MADQLRKIQHDAYYNFYKAAAITDLQLGFMEREKLFSQLRTTLQISSEQHTAIMGKLEQDDSVGRIRDALGKSGGMKRPRPSEQPVGKAPAAVAPKRMLSTKAAPAKPAKAAAQQAGPIQINEHVGERLKMYWPEEGGWFDAIISDYDAAQDKHCLTYHINSPEETFEWVHLKDLKEGEYRRLGRDPAGLATLQLGMGRAAAAPAARGGRGAAGAKTAAAPAAAAPPRATGLADIESQINRARDPKKLEEVQQQLAAQAEAMRAKLQALQSDSEDDAGGMTESESE